jgi:hypothetical protein
MRTDVILRGPWGLCTRWRLYAGATAGLTAVLAALVLVMPGDPPARDLLVADDPTPTFASTASAEPTPSPSPRETVSDSPTAEPSPETANASTGSPVPLARIAGAETRLLLSNDFVARSFAQGRTAQVSTKTQSTWGPLWSCYAPQSAAPVTRAVTRVWSWSGEITLDETIGEHPSVEAARSQFGDCAAEERLVDGLMLDGSRRPEIGDEAYLFRRGQENTTAIFGGARVGRYLVVIDWRQGGSASSMDVVEHALRAAVAKASGQSEGDEAAGPAPTTAAAFDGMLTQGDLGPWSDRPWEDDWRQEDSTIACTGAYAMPISSSVSRGWAGEFATSASEPRSVYLTRLTITRSRASDPSTAAADFEACRASITSADSGGKVIVEDVPGVGDAAFRIKQHDERWPEGGWLWVRAAGTYVVVITPDVDEEADVDLARTVIQRDPHGAS